MIKIQEKLAERRNILNQVPASEKLDKQTGLDKEEMEGNAEVYQIQTPRIRLKSL